MKISEPGNRSASRLRCGRLCLGCLLLLSVVVLSVCTRRPENAGPRFGKSPEGGNSVAVYHFAIHPLHNPSKLMEVYQPLMDYLNARLPGAHLSLEASRDYANFEEKYRAGKPEFILPNPWQTLQAMNAGYHVLAMAGDAHDFKGILVVRKDGGIRTPQDLKGRAVSYPAPTALAACIMPQYFLHRSGIDVTSAIENRYVGSQESSIMNVYLGQTAAGATWPPPWRQFQKEHPREAEALTVLCETESLINNSVMMRDDLPADLRQRVQQLLAGLEGTEEGRTLLASMETVRFIAATDEDYWVVRDYVARFEREVRKVDAR